MIVSQRQPVTAIYATLKQEETLDLMRLVINEQNLGFVRHLMVAQHCMGIALAGLPVTILVNQLAAEYARNQRNLLNRLMVQARLGKMLDPRSFQDSYQETLLLQISHELNRQKPAENLEESYSLKKEIRLTKVLTPEELKELEGHLTKWKGIGILRHWLFVTALMGKKPEGWCDGQKELLSELEFILELYCKEHKKIIENHVSTAEKGDVISLKEVSREQEERLTSMMKLLNGLFMFPLTR